MVRFSSKNNSMPEPRLTSRSIFETEDTDREVFAVKFGNGEIIWQ